MMMLSAQVCHTRIGISPALLSDPDPAPYATRIEKGALFLLPAVGPPRLLFGGVDYGGSGGPTGSWSVAPGGRFLMRWRPEDELRRKVAEELFPERIQIVQGWFEELEAKAPSRP